MILVVLGVGFLGAGIALVVGRRRVAKNMEAAGVIPAWIKSPVAYVVALGVGQVALGTFSLAAAAVPLVR